jgi:MFS superfamily sulfate permease-like transporter
VLFLAGLFTNLPEAVLGAVVIDAALGLVKLPVLHRVRDTSRTDFAAFAAAGIGLFFIGVLAGVLIGVALSLLLLVAAVSQSPVRRMAFDAKENVYVDAETHPDAVAPEDVLVAAIAGPLFFADAAPFRQAVIEMVADQSPKAVVIDLGAATTMDMDGAEVLIKLKEELGKKGIVVALARVPDSQLDLLTRAGTIEAVGKENVFATGRDAVADQSQNAASAS